MNCYQFSVRYGKYFIYVSNLLLLIMATTVIGLCIKVRMINYGLYYHYLSIFFIVIEAFVVIIVPVGYYGVFKKNGLIANIYFYVIFLTSLILGCANLYSMMNEYEIRCGPIEDLLKNVYEKMHKGESSYINKVDEIQIQLECCGVNDNTEEYVKPGNDKNNLISSCCKDSPAVCTADKAYNEGCGEKYGKLLLSFIKPLEILGFTQGVSAVIPLVFMGNLKKSYQQSDNV